MRGLFVKYTMEIIRITPSAFPLLSPDEVQQWLRIDANQDSDTISLLTSSALEIVEGITNLTIGAATYRVTFDCRDTRYRIPLTNVTGITSVTVDGAAMVAGWRREGCSVVFDEVPASPPVITVMAGFGSVETVPDSLRHAIAVLVSAGFNSREELDDRTFQTVTRLCQRYRRITL